MSGVFYQYDTRGASPASQIINLERMLEERDAEIELLTVDNERLRAERDDAVKAEREACAKVCDGIEAGYHRREGRKRPEERSDAETGAGQCAYAIRTRGQEPPR